MWGALMMDYEPPGRRRLSLHGCIHGVSSSEVPHSDARTTELGFKPEANLDAVKNA